ncbi:M56 family metallopeptidase [Streptomyces sp. NPDC006339]|uniref:M56 family metallopeptidase n=1 Tax=Streptomyces sp. NPDC006339 TaxID=3156755 RepID=UPI00339E55A0
MATFLVTVALALYDLVLTEKHVHDGLVGLLTACGLDADAPLSDSRPTLLEVAALLAPMAFLSLPLFWLVRTVWIARRERRDHLRTLDLIGREVPEYGAKVVEFDVPAVYCVPGRRPAVVITRGALDVLDGEQVKAVLEHERAHLDGHHHLVHMIVRAFALAFPGLSLARHAEEQTRLLLEMIADDGALRHHTPDALATALCEVAAGQAPAPALGAGGPGTLLRLYRVLEPRPIPHRAVWPVIVALSAAVPLLPLATACGPV